MESLEKSQLITAWMGSAKEDLETAKGLVSLKRYRGALFFCHLALEKILKAAYVKTNDRYPPPTHKLAKLARESKIEVSEEQIDYLSEITTFNVEARYDIFKEKLYKKATREFTLKYLRITQELFEYFLSKI